METVEFNSLVDFFMKERADLKSNTVRAVDYNDPRFMVLSRWYYIRRYGNIKITCRDPKDSFIRRVCDVSYFLDGKFVIISWIPMRNIKPGPAPDDLVVINCEKCGKAIDQNKAIGGLCRVCDYDLEQSKKDG